jgi:hypothetical protein
MIQVVVDIAGTPREGDDYGWCSNLWSATALGKTGGEMDTAIALKMRMEIAETVNDSKGFVVKQLHGRCRA